MRQNRNPSKASASNLGVLAFHFRHRIMWRERRMKSQEKLKIVACFSSLVWRYVYCTLVILLLPFVWHLIIVVAVGRHQANFLQPLSRTSSFDVIGTPGRSTYKGNRCQVVVQNSYLGLHSLSCFIYQKLSLNLHCNHPYQASHQPDAGNIEMMFSTPTLALLILSVSAAGVFGDYIPAERVKSSNNLV